MTNTNSKKTKTSTTVTTTNTNNNSPQEERVVPNNNNVFLQSNKSSTTQQPQQQQQHIGIAHSSQCDRRLSRAARTIIQKEILPILTKAMNDNNSNNDDDDDNTVNHNHNHNHNNEWSEEEHILMHAIDKFQSSKHKCGLDPRRDVLRNHETHSSISSHSNQKIQSTHKCDLCHKSFRSLFYLDRHLDNVHSHDVHYDHDHDHDNQHEQEEEGYWICLATTICPAFGYGMDYCAEVSYTLEPHYHPGTNRFGTNNNNNNKQHDHYQNDLKAQRKRPCQDSDMELARMECNHIIQSCFTDPQTTTTSTSTTTTVSDALIGQICNKITCHDRLHNFVQSQGSSTNHKNDLVYQMYHPKMLEEEWNKHHNHWNSIGLGGYIILILLCLFYGIYYWNITNHGDDDSENGHAKKADWRGRRNDKVYKND